jgi:hypothetical protein
MENNQNFELNPLSLESEFKVQSVKHRLHELSRKDLELLLSDALDLLVKLTDQSKQMRSYIEKSLGKGL